MKTKRKIVKVQIPLLTFGGEGEALFYNEDQSVHCMFPVTEELLEWMEGEPKKFFYFHISKKHIVLDEEAPWQDW